jgi:hypothetical protein
VRASTAWLAREMARYNEVQARVAQRHGARYFDLRIPQTLDMFFDDAHYTDRGSAAVADAVYPSVLALAQAAAARAGY